MAQNIPDIDDFPQDGRLWRVGWFGQVSRASNKELEPNIEVQLSPFIGSPSDPSHIHAVKNNEKTIVPIGVGLLPYVFIGSIWKNGSLQLMSRYHYSKWDKPIEFTAQSMKIMRPLDKVNERSLITNDYYFIDPGSCKESQCLVVTDREISAYLIIPEIELIRFYYIVSEQLAVSQFLGELQKSSKLFDPTNEDDHSSREPFTFELPNNFRKSDTRILARIAASKTARINAAKIHQSIMIQSANNASWHPATYPPFIGKTHLKAHGKWILSGGHWRFLVYWIDSCSGKFPFSGLIAESDQIPAEVNDKPSDDAKNVVTEKTVRRTRTQQAVQEGSKIDTTVDTISEKPDNEILFNRERFPDFKKERVEFHTTKPKVPKETTVVRATRKKKEKRKLATGTGSPGDADAGKVSFGEESESPSESPIVPSLAPFLQKIYDGLCHLQKKYPEEFSFALITTIDKKSEIFNYAIGPIQKVPRFRNDIKLPWAVCGKNNGKWVRRQLLIAEALYNGKYFYFFEAERRLKKDEAGKTTDKDGEMFTALMVYKRDYSQVSKDDLTDVILECAYKEYLDLGDDELVHLGRAQLRHTGWTSSDLIAGKLKRKMDSVLPKEKREKKKKKVEIDKQ